MLGRQQQRSARHRRLDDLDPTGSFTDEDEPTAVAPGETWASIAAGPRHACGVKLDGALKCWGEGSNGQLGDGTRPVTSPKPVPDP